MKHDTDRSGWKLRPVSVMVNSYPDKHEGNKESSMVNMQRFRESVQDPDIVDFLEMQGALYD